MKLFFAGGFLEKGGDSYVWDKKRLYSYFYILDRDLTMEEFSKVLRRRKDHNKTAEPKDLVVDLFLDSGAYSADSTGVEINLEDYAEFIKRYQRHITVYANLDVIGDAKASYENQLKLEGMGLSPLPVFHNNEPWDYLDMYLEKYDYIGLGGTARAGQKARDNFLDRCWDIICDTPDRTPKVKVHGFGMTSIRHISRYPWYSVDSTSWILTGRMGYVFVPHHEHGRWIYDGASKKIAVSNKSPTVQELGAHISTMPPAKRDVVISYFKEKGYVLGRSEYKMEQQDYELKEDERWFEKKPKNRNKKRKVEMMVEPGLCNIHQQRDELNISFFQDLEAAQPEWPWSYKSKRKFKPLL